MRIERATRRSSPLPLVGCGCAGILIGGTLVVVLALVVLLPALPGLAVRFAGFTPIGSTSGVFAAAPPPPEMQVQNPVAPGDAVLNLGSYGTQPLSADARYYSVTTGTSAAGAPVALVTFTENSLMELCHQRTDICSNTNSQYRNVRLDLRPGGAVVYADLRLPELGIWQAVGVALRLDASGRQFEVAGVDVGGTLYDLPPSGLGEQVAQIAAAGNDLLRQLELIAGGGRYTLSQVYIDDTTLTLLLR